MSFQTKLNKVFDNQDNLIEFGNSDFQVFLKLNNTFTSWEMEEFEFETWHIFLKFTKEYNKDPTTLILYKFLKQKGDFRDKENASNQLEKIYSKILNENIALNRKDLNLNTWAKYLEPVINQKHLI